MGVELCAEIQPVLTGATEDNPAVARGARRPVENVPWDVITRPDGFRYSGSDDIDSVAWYDRPEQAPRLRQLRREPAALGRIATLYSYSSHY